MFLHQVWGFASLQNEMHSGTVSPTGGLFSMYRVSDTLNNNSNRPLFKCWQFFIMWQNPVNIFHTWVFMHVLLIYTKSITQWRHNYSIGTDLAKYVLVHVKRVRWTFCMKSIAFWKFINKTIKKTVNIAKFSMEERGQVLWKLEPGRSMSHVIFMTYPIDKK